jgi:hypothetical protein
MQVFHISTAKEEPVQIAPDGLNNKKHKADPSTCP